MNFNELQKTTPHCRLWADCLENMGYSTCYNPMGLHGVTKIALLFLLQKTRKHVFSALNYFTKQKNRVPTLLVWHPTVHRPIENTASNHNHTKWRTYSRWILIQKVWLNYERNEFSSAQHILTPCSLASLNIPEENVFFIERYHLKEAVEYRILIPSQHLIKGIVKTNGDFD
jgi:hypothetical protein